MINRLPPLLVLFALGVGLVVSSGCATRRVRYTAYASVEPPLPYDEYVGESPGPDYVWIPGYWWWDSVDYVWVRGRWAIPPQSGYVWVRSGWVYDGGSYVFVHGRWSRPSTVVRYRYVHPNPRVHVRPGVQYRSAPRRGARVRPRR